MSIQNRLLFVYTSIFMVAFVLFAAIVYLLPRSRIEQEVDTDLYALADALQSADIVPIGGGAFSIGINQEIYNLETAASFFIMAGPEGNIGLHSQNLSQLTRELGLLDPDGLQEREVLNYVVRGDSTLRVLTTPIYNDE
ncbi:MAG: hypothetical protein H6656_22290, partial [Ardenticatenaceae bacterium]|nr:hypothetical protein [Ardenticatenaceae bacterium]